jgi:hypothetical protein
VEWKKTAACSRTFVDPARADADARRLVSGGS